MVACAEARVKALRERTSAHASAAGTDPSNDCAASFAATCGDTRVCSGSGSCAVWASATLCPPASCSGSVLTQASMCNGTGNCLTGAQVSCGSYACNATGDACRTFCTTNTDCADGYGCSAGVCQ